MIPAGIQHGACNAWHYKHHVQCSYQLSHRDTKKFLDNMAVLFTQRGLHQFAPKNPGVGV